VLPWFSIAPSCRGNGTTGPEVAPGRFEGIILRYRGEISKGGKMNIQKLTEPLIQCSGTILPMKEGCSSDREAIF